MDRARAGSPVRASVSSLGRHSSGLRMRLIEPRLRAAFVVATLAAATGCARGVAVPGARVPASPEPRVALRAGLGRIDCLWVVRTALVQPASVDSMVERARRMGVRGLLVQVVGRGDAWYRSDLLPRPEALALAPPDYDPLARVLDLAHAAGPEVTP